MSLDVKVINDNKMEQRVFNSVEEFDLFYQKYKDIFNTKTTNYLNKTYKIQTPDAEYRITKRNCKDGVGEVYLKKITSSTNDSPNYDLLIENLRADYNIFHEEYVNKIKSIEALCNALTAKINQLTATVNECSQAINQLNI